MSKTREEAERSKAVYYAYIILAIAGITASIYKLFKDDTELAIKSIGLMLAGVLIAAIISAIIKNNKDLQIVSKILLYAFTAFVLFCLFCLTTGIPEKFYNGPLTKMISIPNNSVNIELEQPDISSQNDEQLIYDYKVTIKTDKENAAGTSDKVEIKLIGDNNSTDWEHLDREFEKDQKYTFQFYSKHKIETLKEVELRITRKESSKLNQVNDLRLERIKIEEPLNKRESEYIRKLIWIGDGGDGNNKKFMKRSIKISWK